MLSKDAVEHRTAANSAQTRCSGRSLHDKAGIAIVLVPLDSTRSLLLLLLLQPERNVQEWPGSSAESAVRTGGVGPCGRARL